MVIAAGCATYGAGFSTMTGEIAGEAAGETAEKMAGEWWATGFKEAFSSFSVFGSNEYSEVTVGNLFGTMKTTSDWSGEKELDISGWTFNTYFKYPIYLLNDRLTLFPMAGVDLHGYTVDGGSGTSGFMAYLKVGGGLDFTFSKSFFLRGRVAYAPIGITGTTFGIALGYRTADDKVKGRYKTGSQIKFEQLQQKVKDAGATGDWQTAIDGYTQLIAKEPSNAAYYFARAEAYLGAKDYGASVKDFNKGAELGVFLPNTNGRPQKWRQLYREYREAQGEEAPMDGRAIVMAPDSSHLQLVAAKTPGLKGAQGSGSEAMLKTGRQEVVFRYSGAMKDLAAMTVGDCALTFNVEEGHVYAAVAGFDGRNFTIRMDDVTARETGLDEEKEPEKVTAFTEDMFYASRFKKGMTIAALRRTGFPETWTIMDGTYTSGIGTGNKRMAFSAMFGDDGLFTYGFASWFRYMNEMADLLTNACGEPAILDSGNMTWLSPEGLIIMRDAGDMFTIDVVPLN
jgi:hypothetical protein